MFTTLVRESIRPLNGNHIVLLDSIIRPIDTKDKFASDSAQLPFGMVCAVWLHSHIHSKLMANRMEIVKDLVSGTKVNL